MKKCCKDPFSPDTGIFRDQSLEPHRGEIVRRFDHCVKKKEWITGEGRLSLEDFAVYHREFGLHRLDDGWIFREWAPNATSIHIIGDMTGWKIDSRFSLERKTVDGVWEGSFPKDAFHHGNLYRLVLSWDKGRGDRLPTAATMVVQDPETLIFNAKVWEPETRHQWAYPSPNFRDSTTNSGELLIYEAHVGMAKEEGGVGTFREFETLVLPRIKTAGYTAIQFMAIQEHPYYGSFGYHVTNFFAVSSRFGTPEEFKSLVDKAHAMGLRVFMDVVHSHASSNEVEGLSRFDGSLDQFFHPGERGIHRLWDSRCFDYGKPMVLKFLLSNLRYWIEEFHIDGFRFDGVTSMLFYDHGLGRAFTSYDDYYGDSVDLDALAYLYIANLFVHTLNPECVTIAEEVSGYPGLAASEKEGGTGFNYRYAMGIPDFWIRLLKEFPDEQWPIGALWYELNSRRMEEQTISYAESHDQALVGDKTLMMHLMGEAIYSGMERTNTSVTTMRAVALHKMIRLITLATAGSGYLNFMGNEFGHPEWIDFPSVANNWSYQHARRQWSLGDNPDLMFSCLADFDRAMLKMAKANGILNTPGAELIFIHQADKVVGFKRAGLIFVFNFHPDQSFVDYHVKAPPGTFKMIMDTDAEIFGGHGRLVADQVHFTLDSTIDPTIDKNQQDQSGQNNQNGQMNQEHSRLSLYLPARTAIVLIPVNC
jgi:1,4-alpha-glucan branching enzyme